MQNAELNNFLKATDIFCNSKFILFDNKLRDYLKEISNCDPVFDLLAKCLKNFDYDNERNKATTKEGFKLPTKAERAIALVFCLLVDVDAKKINFFTFLKEFFEDDDINECLRKFCEKVIVPFKNMVIVMLEGDITEIEEEEELAEEVIEAEEKEEINAELLAACEKIDNFAIENKNLEDAHQIALAMVYAVKENNSQLLNSLLVALLNATKNRKFLKFVKDCLNPFLN